MLYIKRNSNNKMVVTVSQNKTLASPYYLFSFQHIMSKETVRFFPKNISTSTARYDEFEFNEGVEPTSYSGDVPYEQFPFEGQYYYGIYECFGTGSTNPLYAFNKVEEGRAYVVDESIPSDFNEYISDNENNANFIYYGEDINQERESVTFKYNAFNSSLTKWGWTVIYPSIFYKDLQTGVIQEKKNYLYDESVCEGTFERVSGDTFTIQITTGSTWPGFKLYMDETQVKSYGYDYAQIGSLNYSGITFNNFNESIIVPGYWSVDLTIHKVDGTTLTTTELWDIDTSNPRNRTIATISGNTEGCLYQLTTEDEDPIITEDGDNIVTENLL